MTQICVFVLVVLSFFPAVRGLDVALIFVHNELDELPVQEKAMRAAVDDLKVSEHIQVNISHSFNVTVRGRAPKTILDSMCQALDKALSVKKTPLILDLTSAGVPSETVKSFSAAMGIPTVSTSVGKVGDIKAWHALDEDQKKYLVQIAPPADTIIDIIRAFVVQFNVPDVAILYGETFATSFKAHGHTIQSAIPGRVMTKSLSNENKAEIKELHTTYKYNQFFVLATMEQIDSLLNDVDSLRYTTETTWYAVALRNESTAFSNEFEFSLMLPVPEEDKASELANWIDREEMHGLPQVEAAFYYDVAIRTIVAAENMVKAGTWPSPEIFFSCNAFSTERVKPLTNFDLKSEIEKVNHPWAYAPFTYGPNGESSMAFKVMIEKVKYDSNSGVSYTAVGDWQAGVNSPINMYAADAEPPQRTRPYYRIVTQVQDPFVIKTREKFSGLCIDLINNISKHLNFDFEIYDVPGASMGFIDTNGEWTGIINDLLEKKADIALSAVSVMVERERVVDFTLPFYEPVGISILMKKAQTPTSLFKFLTVLETDVWLCILAAFFLTSFLMWVFDRWSPYSYQNNMEKYKDDDEKRIFNFKECLWFCLTSLTPQGGGEAPKNLSGRLVAATWWLFGFIIMASYTANLAAFLTVSRLDTPIESLDDLSKQYKIRYAPIQDSSEMRYFKRMADIENQFYEIWKDMSLNDSLTPLERSKLAVWDYPVSDKFTKMWQAMTEAGMPANIDDALARIFNDSPVAEPFALLNDASENLYYFHTRCELQIIGDQFSRKPYAIALQKGSHLLQPFNDVLQQLINEGELTRLKQYWWGRMSIRDTCEELKEEEDGISIKNIGGVFIVIVLGIGFAILTLTLEFSWHQYRHGKSVGNEAWTSQAAKSQQAAEAAQFANKYLDAHDLYGDHFTKRANAKKPANSYYQW